MLLQDIIPYIQRTFRVRNDKDGRALPAFPGAGTRPRNRPRNTDRFGYLGAFSGAIFLRPEEDYTKIYDGAFADAAKFNKDVHVLFMGMGSEEGFGSDTIVKNLNAIGIRSVLPVSGTAHEWLTWRRCLNEFIPMLFRK